MRDRATSTLALCLAVMILDGLDMQVLAFAAPVILKAWSIDPAALAPAMASSILGMALGSALGGALGDRLGRSKAIIISVMLFGGFTLATAFARDVWLLTLLRLACGLGLGAASPNVMVLASEAWRSRPGQAVGLMAAGAPLGGMVGAAGANWLIGHYGWQAVFVVGGAVPLAFGVLLLFALKEPPALAMEVEPGPKGGGLGEVFSRPYLRTSLTLFLGFSANAFAVYVLMTWLPVALTQGGFDLATALQGSLALNLAALAGSIGGGALISTLGSRKTGVAAAAAGLATTALLGALLLKLILGGSAPLVLLILVGVGLSISTIQATLFTLGATAYPRRCRTTGLGVVGMVGRLAGLGAVLLAGLLLSLKSGALLAVFALILTALAVAGVAFLIFDRHTTRVRSTVSPAGAHR